MPKDDMIRGRHILDAHFDNPNDEIYNEINKGDK